MANGHGGRRANTGGARPGAGRKPGAVTVKTRAAADADAALGLLEPLPLILERMRVEYAAGNFDRAVELAEKVLSFRHPRLCAIDMSAAVREVPPDESVREIVVSTREEAAALLPHLAETGGVPGQP